MRAIATTDSVFIFLFRSVLYYEGIAHAKRQEIQALELRARSPLPLLRKSMRLSHNPEESVKKKKRDGERKSFRTTRHVA